jgi:transcriptional regulator with XRE-family HTH domain
VSPGEPSIGRLVREAREQEKLSREALATPASVRLEALAALEEGQAFLSTAKLGRIAGALGLDPIAILEGQAVVRPDPTIYFRHARIADFHDEDVDRLRPALAAGLALLDCRALLGEPASLRSRFTPEPVGASPHASGYDAARRVRAALGDRSGPLHDLWALLEERFDVAVCTAALRTRSVMAVTVKERVRGGAAIVMNAGFVNYRKRPLVGRVNLAHELAHVLFDPENDEVNMIVVDRVDPRDARGGTGIEQRARAFAAELLIPAHGLSSRFGAPIGITEPSTADALVDDVRGLFLTPAEITVNHLVNRGYIADDEALREDLIRSAAMRSPVDTQALAPVIPPEGVRSAALLERVREAHDRGLLTDGRARELLGLAGGEPLPWDATR